MSTTTAVKKIGPVLATFMVANNMIGSGFFLLPATLAKSGTVTALSWLLGTLLAVALGAAFARIARQHPDLTSPDDYVRPSLGRDMGFLASTLYWLSSWIGNNAIAVAAFGYLIILLPIEDGLGVRLAGQVLLIWAMFGLNLLGPRSWNVSGESDAMVAFGSLAVVFWAFIGLETGAMVAGVVRDPDRNVPIATLGGILLAGVVYLTSSVLMMGIVPVQELAGSSAPFALVAGRMFGEWAIPVIAAAAALKATGTLGGWMMVTGESGARAAQRGFLPAVFGRVRRNGAASTGLLLIVLAMTLIALTTLSDSVSSQFEVIINMAVTLVVMAYVAAGLSLLLGSPARPATTSDRLLGMGALVACGLLVWSTPIDTLIGAVIIALLALAAYRGFGRRRPAAS